MTIRKFVLALSTIVWGSAGFAQAQGLNCVDFRRNINGSWTAINSGTLTGPSGDVRYFLGELLRPGLLEGGVDISGLLERRCHLSR